MDPVFNSCSPRIERTLLLNMLEGRRIERPDLFEPVRKPLSVRREVMPKLANVHPRPVNDFIRIGVDVPVKRSDEHVIEFVLRQSIFELGAVDEAADADQVAVKSHLFVESSPCGRDQHLVGTRVTATRIRPESSRMVLALGATLKEYLSPLIENEHGECPMQKAVLVRRKFLYAAHGLVIFIDEHQILRHRLIHGWFGYLVCVTD